MYVEINIINLNLSKVTKENITIKLLKYIYTTNYITFLFLKKIKNVI